MADDGFPTATSARARRTRSAAAATQKTFNSSLDDFLGGASKPAPAPVSEPAKGMPEPGGWVTDKSGVENYEQVMNKPFESFPMNGLVCEDCGEPQRTTPSGESCKNGHGGARGLLISEFNARMQERGRFPKVEPISEQGPTPKQVAMIHQALETPTPVDNESVKALIPRVDDVLSHKVVNPLDQSFKPDLPPAYGRIVRTLFAFNPDAVFDELEASMRLPKPMRDMGYLELSELLDQASRHHVNASKLYADAKVKLALFEADCLAISGDMRKQASDQLKKEKDEAKGGKMITEGDVEARIAQIFPDEFRRQTKLRNEMKATVGHFETFVKSWELRRRELDTMLRECRK